MLALRRTRHVRAGRPSITNLDVDTQDHSRGPFGRDYSQNSGAVAVHSPSVTPYVSKPPQLNV